MSAQYIFGMSLDAFLHTQRRIGRPYGMVLVSKGCAEQGNDAIAHSIADRSLVVVNGLHHQLEDWIEKFAGFLRIAVG